MSAIKNGAVFDKYSPPHNISIAAATTPQLLLGAANFESVRFQFVLRGHDPSPKYVV